MGYTVPICCRMENRATMARMAGKTWTSRMSSSSWLRPTQRKRENAKADINVVDADQEGRDRGDIERIPHP